MIYWEFARYPLYITRYGRIVEYWLKVLKSGDTKLCKISNDNLLRELQENETVENWPCNVKNLLCKMGFVDVWYSLGVLNQTLFLRQFKLRLRDIYYQEWIGTLHDEPKARVYGNFIR